MNCYLTVPAAKRALGIASTDFDTLVLEYIQAATEDIEAYCHRHFYTTTATRKFSVYGRNHDYIDDLLTITTATVVDPDDSDFDALTFASTEYELSPLNVYPRMRFRFLASSDQSIPSRAQIQILGVWGHGDGTASPWTVSGITGTVADASGLTLTLSTGSVLEAGHTIKIGAEQMLIISVSGASAIVRRGENGTTAAAQSAAAISIAQYPPKIIQGCRELVCEAMNRRRMTGQSSQTVDQYSRSMLDEGDREKMMQRLFGCFVRGT